MPEEQQSPLDPLVLTMSDEMQYRCAGFVQAEIERYASELEGDRPHEREENNAGSDSGSSSEDDDGGQGANGKGRGRRKETQQKGTYYSGGISIVINYCSS